MRTLYAVVAILLSSLIPATSEVRAENIHFQDVEPPKEALNFSPQVKPAKKRYVKIDAKGLLDTANRSMNLRQSIRIFVFEDDYIDVHVQEISRGVIGKSAIISGYVGNNKDELFSGAIKANRVMLSFYKNGFNYYIEFIGSGVTLIRKSRPAPELLENPNDMILGPKSGSLDQHDDKAKSASSSKSLVVQVFLTEDAASNVIDIGDIVDQSIWNLQKTLNNSGAYQQVVVSGYYYLEGYYEGNKNLARILSDFNANKVVAEYRAYHKADIVVVFVERNEGCGLGNYAEKPRSKSTPGRAFSVNVASIDCVSYFGVAHEVGHNLGLKHSRYDEKLAGRSGWNNGDAYNFGFTNKYGGFYDVMAYSTECIKSKIANRCFRKPYFSDPSVKINGKYQLGIRKSAKRPAYAALRVRETIGAVSGYR